MHIEYLTLSLCCEPEIGPRIPYVAVSMRFVRAGNFAVRLLKIYSCSLPISSYPTRIPVFDVDGEGITNGRVFVDMDPASSDGIRTDVDGNLWAGACWAGDGYDGLHCFAPDGSLIGKIHLPAPCANLCFGGAKKNRLFMTCSQSLFSVYVETVGAQVP